MHLILLLRKPTKITKTAVFESLTPTPKKKRIRGCKKVENQRTKDKFLHRVTRSEAYKLPNLFSFKLGALTVFADSN